MIICTIAIVLLYFLFWSIIRAGKDKVTMAAKLIESNIEHPTYFIYSRGFRDKMCWKKYLSSFGDSLAKKIQLIRQYVIENGVGGSPLNVTSNRCFLFSDGETLKFSDRGWIEFQKALTSESKHSKLRRDL